MGIHPQAIVDPKAKVHPSVEIGPFAIIKGDVEMGPGNVVESHCVIGSEFGQVVVGSGNHFYSGAMVGGPPQDLKFANEKTRLEIGNENKFREFVTVNVGTETGGGVTRIGNKNLFMAYVHVAHDCQIGSHIAIANASNFAGHVTVEDHVRIGGVCNFNQFIRIGKYSFIAGDSAVNKDIMPFTIAQGKYAVSRALNAIGLERAGFTSDDIDSLHRAIRYLTKGERTLEQALLEIQNSCTPSDSISYLVEFIKSSQRGIAR